MLAAVFFDGKSIDTVVEETCQPQPTVFALIRSGIDKLRDDISGYTSEASSADVEDVDPTQATEEPLLDDYSDDSGDEYPWLTNKQLKHRRESEVSYAASYSDHQCSR